MRMKSAVYRQRDPEGHPVSLLDLVSAPDIHPTSRSGKRLGKWLRQLSRRIWLKEMRQESERGKCGLALIRSGDSYQRTDCSTGCCFTHCLFLSSVSIRRKPTSRFSGIT